LLRMSFVVQRVGQKRGKNILGFDLKTLMIGN
jgi:hypothetical protein